MRKILTAVALTGTLLLTAGCSRPSDIGNKKGERPQPIGEGGEIRTNDHPAVRAFPGDKPFELPDPNKEPRPAVDAEPVPEEWIDNVSAYGETRNDRVVIFTAQREPLESFMISDWLINQTSANIITRNPEGLSFEMPAQLGDLVSLSTGHFFSGPQSEFYPTTIACSIIIYRPVPPAWLVLDDARYTSTGPTDRDRCNVGGVVP